VSADGTIEWFQGLSTVADVEGSPIIADISGDGFPEVICGYPSGLTVFDSLGNELAGFPDATHDAKLPIIADIDNTGKVEAVVGSSNWNLYAYTKGGQQASGFPIQLGNRIESSAAVYDIDGDGTLELMVSSNDYKFYIFALDSRWFEWPTFRYDPYNSGVYKSGNLPGISNKDDVLTGERFGLRVRPSIFSRAVEIAFPVVYRVSSEEHSRVSLKIFDVTGRLIKDFNMQSKTPYLMSPIMWFGDDDCGREVSSGVYFVRFEAENQAMTEKFVKIK